MVDDSYRGYRNDPHGRGGAASSEPATDPLTELARLIGQSDPFGERNRRTDSQGSADWRNDPQPPAYPDPHAGYDDRYAAAPNQQAHYPQHSDQAGYDDGQHYDAHQYAANGTDHYAANGAAPYAANGADQAYAKYSEQGGNNYANPHGHGGAPYHQEPPPQPPHYADANAGAYNPAPHDAPNLGPPPYFGADPHADRPDAYYDDAPAPRHRGWLITVAALVGLAVLGTAGAFAYRKIVSGGPPPLITRDVRPDKVAPPQSADANRQPDRLAAGNEQMAPPPEQPINVAVAPPPMPAPQSPAPLTAMPAAPAAAAPSASSAPNTSAVPRKVPTVKIAPGDEPGATAAPRPITPRAAATPPPRDANAPLSLSPQAQDRPQPSRNVAPSQPTRTTALAPAAAPPTETAGGGAGYYVQVSAQKSQEEARTSYRNIQAKYASVLGSHAPVFRRKDLGSKGVFYGAQVGPFSHEGAVHLCEQLKSAGGSCMVQHN